MNNPAFWRAIHSLAHPISLIAILALLLNDHFLRIHSPSWLTGKLGDFAWLVFAPFICAAALAWLVRVRQQEKVVGIAAFAFIGVWFALAKTTPLVHSWTMDALEVVVGYRGTLRIDPTDLVTLPALLIGWHVWRSVHNTPQTLKPRAWVLLALGTFATLANSVMYAPFVSDRGIICVDQTEQQLTASSVNRTFISIDGGITWSEGDRIEVEPNQYGTPPPLCAWSARENYVTVDGQIFRFGRGTSIDYHVEYEDPWITDFDLSAVASEARRLYHEDHYVDEGAESFVYQVAPFGAVVDTQTGNLIVAMGHDGVLVRKSSGDWQWVAVGQYHYPDFNQLSLISAMLVNYLPASLFLLVLAPMTLYRSRQQAAMTLWLCICWVSWVALAFAIFLRDFMPLNILEIIVDWAALICAFIAFICSSFTIFELLKRYPRVIVPIVIISLVSAVVFTAPFYLWLQAVIALSPSASLYAALLAIATLIVGRLYLGLRYPALYNQKRKAEIAQRLAAGELVADADDEHEDAL